MSSLRLRFLLSHFILMQKLFLAVLSMSSLSIVSIFAAETTMNHSATLTTYVEALNTHQWEHIAPHVAEEAVFIFTEDTFIGHAAAKAAFEKTFNLIEKEVFSLHDVTWTAVSAEMASCHYEFRWKGLINGEEASGGGRGTSILRKVGTRWLILHDHLGPYPRK